MRDFGVSTGRPLAIILEYDHSEQIEFPNSEEGIPFRVRDLIDFTKYEEAFSQVQNHLRNGNCYQVNLTAPLSFDWEEKIPDQKLMNELLTGLKKSGSYSFCTHLLDNDFIFLSHSPECLFRVEHESGENPTLKAMPIKGTARNRDELMTIKKIKPNLI